MAVENKIYSVCKDCRKLFKNPESKDPPKFPSVCLLRKEKTETPIADSIRRYTQIKYLWDIIKHKRLTLLDPLSKWNDQNDTNFIKAYVARKSTAKNKPLKCFALCFCERSDLFHHWEIYGRGRKGVCIEFNRLKLSEAAENEEIIHGKVIYLTVGELKELKKININNEYIDAIPFVKRRAFEDEREYRLIYTTDDQSLKSKFLEIKDLTMINRIIINPWLSSETYKKYKKRIDKLTGNRIKVEPSEMLGHHDWVDCAEALSRPAEKK